MIFSFYTYSQYLVMIIIPYISTVLSTLRQAANLSPPPSPTKKRKKKEKEQWQPPRHPAQSDDFLCSSVMPFLIDNPVLTWNVHLIRCYRNRLHGAKYPHLKATGTFSIKFWSLIVLSPDFFQMSPTFWKVGAPGPKNWNSWLEHCRCHAHFRLLEPSCWYKFTYLMKNSADPDQLASSEANWSGSILFAKSGHIRVQKNQD